MKKILFIFALTFVAITSNAQISPRGDLDGDGFVSVSDVMELVKIILYGDATQVYLTCPDDHHPHMIDLGLPSGTRWACCNVDDDHSNQSPTNYGSYYAWGELKGKDYFDWDNYIHCDGSYDTCHDIGSDIAGTEYDVAHYQWGGSWVMPSSYQIQELLDNCSSEWTTLNGVNGRRFTGSNGGTIFLPASGFRAYEDLYAVGYRGRYWSSTLFPSVSYWVYYLDFQSDFVVWDNYIRSCGQSVRPVSR